MDLRRFKELKMFMHLEEIKTTGAINEGDLSAIIRLGTDLNDNFYQVEVPLIVSENNATAAVGYLARGK